jgi:hypothetical protein
LDNPGVSRVAEICECACSVGGAEDRRSGNQGRGSGRDQGGGIFPANSPVDRDVQLAHFGHLP